MVLKWSDRPGPAKRGATTTENAVAEERDGTQVHEGGKLDAIAPVQEQGYSAVWAAERLDINVNMLRRWIKQHHQKGGGSSRFRSNHVELHHSGD